MQGIEISTYSVITFYIFPRSLEEVNKSFYSFFNQCATVGGSQATNYCQTDMRLQITYSREGNFITTSTADGNLID